MTASPSHLDLLEAESIHIFREAAAQFRKPVMLYSIGKDSTVLLHLARKAFFPQPLPFPLLHVDTTWKFKDMIAFRDRTAKDFGLDLIVHINEDGIKRGINPIDHAPSIHTDVLKTQALEAGARQIRLRRGFRRRTARRGSEPCERTRFLFPRERSPLGSAPATPGDVGPVERPPRHRRNGPRLPDVELDRERCLALHPAREARGRAALFRSRAADDRAQRAAVDAGRCAAATEAGEKVEVRKIRFRTLGDYPLTAAVESDADTIEAVVAETLERADV